MSVGNVNIIQWAHTNTFAHNKLKKAENVLLWLAMTYNQTRVHGYRRKKPWQLWFPAWLPNQTHRPQTDEDLDISDDPP